MPPIRLRNHFLSDMTTVSNEFIDRYMVDANGEYVKIYLYILRLTQNSDRAWTLATIAEKLDCTTLDVNRAVSYWTRRGLLVCDYNEAHQLIGVTFLDPEELAEESATENDTSLSASRIRTLKRNEEVKQVLYVAEQYLAHPLSAMEAEALLYFYDKLHFSADLLEYLIEYCVSKGGTSLAYIKKVGFSWSEEGITTVEEAKTAASARNKDYYEIMRAYGLTGRNVGAAERDYIRRWLVDYGFTTDVILLAVNRTMMNIHSPKFEYTDSILRSWNEDGVLSVADVEALDAAHSKEKTPRKTRQNKNSFNNFTGRNYDYDQLEQQLSDTQYGN